MEKNKNLVSSTAQMKKQKKEAKGSYKNDSQSCLMHFSPFDILL